jgi:hypothetical protein
MGKESMSRSVAHEASQARPTSNHLVSPKIHSMHNAKLGVDFLIQ